MGEVSAKWMSVCRTYLLMGEAPSGSTAARRQSEEMADLSSWTRELLKAPRTMTYPCALNSAICSGESAAIAAPQIFSYFCGGVDFFSYFTASNRGMPHAHVAVYSVYSEPQVICARRGTPRHMRHYGN